LGCFGTEPSRDVSVLKGRETYMGSASDTRVA
jgi:hypothetical protein